MPIYEYQCGECGRRTEAIQRHDEEPLTTCPSCGGPLVKLMSAPAFQFKGTGWYVTDYADKKKKTDEKTDEKTGEQAESKDSGKDTSTEGDGKSSTASSGSSSEGSTVSSKSSSSSSSE